MAEATRPFSTFQRLFVLSLLLLWNSDAYSIKPGFVSPVYVNKFSSKTVLSPLWQSSNNNEIVKDTDNVNGDTNAPVIRSFDKKIQKLNRDKMKFMEKLNAYEAELQNLNQKKEEYIAKLQVGQPPVGGNFSETTMRSVVKALCWRVIAGSITFLTSFRFSGSLTTALSIVGSDFFSKAFTMFIGERLMNKSQAGRKGGADDPGRSLIKALVWRLFAICNTLTMSWLISKDLSIASKIAGSDAIFKTALMFVYERVWARIEWGKEYIIEFSI
eukprot:CAMPEP_0197834146 /NCGR_PEP_ID=MMETSP1437-20131217/21346_1 /TAXON_ID=49252 ORGANISM="Eucampia antarctica, Strain CCMP1452" /NCGR_SAMPLE_ID=MMETSP1437 /ASSEMBLY_ACC=CAM_ASM_001096 /LENGTH=271 /DNA_ID=CAMNT_0043438625 /DNA_START=44 /DNA_END=859 /DNA_ORIENTATION=+